MIDTSNLAPDDLVRRWPAECAIDFDDAPDCAGEGGFIAVLAVILLSAVAVGSFLAAIS